MDEWLEGVSEGLETGQALLPSCTMIFSGFSSAAFEKERSRTLPQSPAANALRPTRASYHWSLNQHLNILKKNQFGYIMDVSNTPHDSGILTIEHEGRMITFNQPSTGKIYASFDDLAQKFRYEVKDHLLQKINYKTVIASVKGTHPQIISAKFSKTEDDSHILSVRVSYEFLPEIVEELKFQKRQIPAQESEQAVIRGMRSYVRGIRDQLNALGSIQVTQGPLDETAETEIFVKLAHKKSVFTLALTMTKMSTNVVKVQMFYYSSITKQRKTSGAVPEEGLYVHHNGNGYIQVKFLADFQDFDMVIFSLPEKHHGQYTLACEKVESL